MAQKGGGPARSFFQIEASFDYANPATFEDIYERYLRGRPRFLIAVQDLRMPAFTPHEQLTGNQHFACAIARMKYWMATEPLPAAGDIEALGAYWKRHYNTAGGAGKARHWAKLYREHVGDLL